MTQPCYGPDYPEDFKKAIEGLAENDESLLAIMQEGPAAISRLEFNLRVEPSDRLNVLFKHATDLASTNPDTVLQAAKALTADMTLLDRKQTAHKACVDICPPKYKPAGRF